MKQKLLLLILALCTSAGAWATTTPASGAYPVEGKQYYLYAQQTASGTSRSYLYNASGTLTVNQGSKSATDAYKWTVVKGEGTTYTIKNVADPSLYLNVNSNCLILSTTEAYFDLGKSVYYSACVSLHTNGKWWVTPASETSFPDGYYLSSFGTSNTWTANYVFEEVLSAHSLTDGSYYTIYCDNDNKQYLYDNAGTLAQTSSAPASDLRYVWQCIVSGDYYNFCNLQTGKYLGWKAMSASAYNYTISTTQAIHDGCATMWGVNAGRNWSIKTDGTFTGQTTTKDDKVTSDWCTDFRFDAVDLSDWCTGTDLGGTLTKGSNTDWSWKWTSPTSPSYTIEVGANNINKTANNNGGMDIRSGSALSATYTITAPTGYLVTGYKFVGYALSGNQTVTPSKGGDAIVFTTTGNSISVSGLRQGKASFTLSGANDGLFVRALQVSLAPIASSITSLPTANNKTYMIYNVRAAWNFADDATSMNAVALDLDDEGQQIALIYHDENYYLYSVNAGKYLTADNTLTSVVTDNEQISITATDNATYPWFFSFKNVASKNINIDGNPTVRINSHSDLDDGNQNAIVEVGDFDATEALAIFDNRYVTYNLSYGGNSTFRTESSVVVAIGGDPADYVPESWKAAYCTLTYDVETIEESTTTVNVTATWNGPFEFSTDYASAVWYYIQTNDQWVKNNPWVSPNLYTDMSNVKDVDDGKWAFIGNPYDGIGIISKHRYDDTYTGYLSATLDANPCINWEFEITEKWTINRTDAKSFTLNTGDKYLTENTTYNRLDYGTDETAAIFSVRSYYCQQALDNWATYVGESTGKLFGVNPSSASAMDAMIKGMPKMTETEYTNNFETIPNGNIAGYISYNQPTTGYYRIKNINTNRYIAYGQPAATGHSYDPGLIAVSNANDASTVVKLTSKVQNDKVIPYTYALTTQGLNVQTMREGSKPFPATIEDMKYFVFDIVSPGVVSIQNTASNFDTNHTGCLHDSNWDITPGIVNWNAASPASQWEIEAAESLTVLLNDGGDGYKYATLCLPFAVTLNEACAYTLTLNDSQTGLRLSDAISAVPAGTPVLLRSESASVTASIAGDASYATTPVTSTDLTGVYVDTAVASDTEVDGTTDYFLGIVNDKIGFYHWAGTTLKANRAYFDSSSLPVPVKGLVLDFEDDATSIQAIDNGRQTTDAAIYNIAGQRLNKTQKGINIVNGKKVLK